jgi:hypothetical protein
VSTTRVELVDEVQLHMGAELSHRIIDAPGGADRDTYGVTVYRTLPSGALMRTTYPWWRVREVTYHEGDD